MTKLHLAAFGLIATILCMGCSSNQKTPEIQAVDRFIYALYSSQTSTLFDGCTVESRAWLAQQLGLKPDAPRDEVLALLKVRYDWKFEKPIRSDPQLYAAPSADRRVVHAEFAGRAWRLALAREENEWRVDLIHSGEREESAN